MADPQHSHVKVLSPRRVRLALGVFLLALSLTAWGYLHFRSNTMLFGAVHIRPFGTLVASQTSGFPTALNHVDVYQQGSTVWIDSYQSPSNGADDPHLYKVNVDAPLHADDVDVQWTDGKSATTQADPSTQFFAHITITFDGKVIFSHDEPLDDRLRRLVGAN
ncbi:hypothetical protein [Actinomyces faecalis]|uniref:hypothetical protein n=1 Tax=Actinomyces faecalis TaxID=2722820 RepID=UPI00155691F8|nr:hypothetical protein [Actinomyces faecalis]